MPPVHALCREVDDVNGLSPDDLFGVRLQHLCQVWRDHDLRAGKNGQLCEAPHAAYVYAYVRAGVGTMADINGVLIMPGQQSSRSCTDGRLALCTPGAAA